MEEAVIITAQRDYSAEILAKFNNVEFDSEKWENDNFRVWLDELKRDGHENVIYINCSFPFKQLPAEIAVKLAYLLKFHSDIIENMFE